MHPDYPQITGPCVHALKAREERLRTLADAGTARLARDTARIREALREQVMDDGAGSASFVVQTAQRLTLAEAREEGYRAAVADLLGAVL